MVLSFWVKIFYDWNIWKGMWLWKSSFEFKKIKVELFIWYTFFALYYTWMLSSRNGHYVPHIVNEAKDPVIFYEWKSCLQEFFKPLKHITDYHHCYIDSKHPGVVKCKESVSYEQFNFNFLKFKTYVEHSDHFYLTFALFQLPVIAKKYYLFNISNLSFNISK
jgi:hypothetical protein